MITHLYRFPVKGLSGERRTALCLEAGEGIKGDRAIALARKPENFNRATAKAQPKHKFLMLMRDEALAALETSYDDASDMLTIEQPGGRTISADLSNDRGRKSIETFFKDYLGDDTLDPKIVSAPGHKFTDISVVSPEKMRAISLINMASLEALDRAEGLELHPLRFRANIYFSGVFAWEELDWVGREIMIGSARAKVVMRTKRCAATQVNPLSAQRDANVPALIKQHFGHFEMGIYAEVLSGAEVSLGDTVTLV